MPRSFLLVCAVGLLACGDTAESIPQTSGLDSEGCPTFEPTLVSADFDYDHFCGDSCRATFGSERVGTQLEGPVLGETWFAACLHESLPRENIFAGIAGAPNSGCVSDGNRDYIVDVKQLTAFFAMCWPPCEADESTVDELIEEGLMPQICATGLEGR